MSDRDALLERACVGSGKSDDRLPLPALLSRAEAAFAEDFDARLRDSEFCSLSLAHSRNVLRYLGEGPLRASVIVGQCNITKQAVSQQIAHLERNGYVEVLPDPTDQRARLVGLTDKGERAQALVHRLFVEIEDEWAAVVGTDEMATVREALRTILEGRGTTC